ncbi:MAG: hypothetical protein LBJ67_02805 [Planctomycetaceae bacterium]|jgi:hypothetical protein|nr:hypothetical protein [Planctomycetaceae bacterium]
MNNEFIKTIFIIILLFVSLINCFSEEVINSFTLKSNQNSLVDLAHNKLDSEKLLDDINKNLIFSKNSQDRDYKLILQKTREMIQKYPDSKATLTLLDSIGRWHSLGLIDEEQFSFFKKKMNDYNNQDNKGRMIIASIATRYHQIETEHQTLDLYQGLIRSCNDILETPNISTKLKCYSLLWLAKISFALKNYSESEKYIDEIIKEYNISHFDFTDRGMILEETYHLKASIAFEKGSISVAANIWKQYIDSCAQQFSDIANAYEKMFLLVDALNENSEKTSKKKILLEEFISSFPDSNAEPLLQARLTLGYVVLNENTFISGNISMEQAKEMAEKYKANAKEAEKIFNNALPLARNTPFEQVFVKALDFANEVQTQKSQQIASVDKTISPSITEIPHRQTRNMVVFVVVNAFLILIIIFLERRRLKNLLISLLFHNR